MATKKEIIERLDLPVLIQELIPSCKQAKGELSGLCPFHEDHNPSLSINPESGVFKCHACGAKGSIFDLYGKVQGLDFKRSITSLTDRAGLAPGKANTTVGRASKSKEVDRHDYQDSAGNLLYQRVRFEPGDNGRSKKYLPFDPATRQWKRPGAPVLYHLPDVLNASTVFIFEGERKADIAKSWRLTGTCFDSGANSTITPAMIEVLTGKEIIILPDNDDSGRKYRDNIIKAMQGKAASIKVVDLPGLAVKGDVVDWIQIPSNDKELFLDLVQQTPEWCPETEAKQEEHVPDQTPQERLFISALDMLSQPVETKPLLGNVIERGCTGQMFGPSGGGKTFVALDMSLAVGTGGRWNGNQCERGIVLYFAGEGHSGLKRRIKAWSKHNGYPDLSSVHVSRSVISFDAAGLRRVVSEVKTLEKQSGQQVALVVIDTLARHLQGDENSTRDMSEFVSSVDGLRNDFPGSTALVVHHTGNNAEQANRSRGSSALKGACDFEIQCDKGFLTYTKVKDGAPPEPVEFKLVPVEIGNDDGGEPITSCIVVYGERSATNKEVRLTQMESQLMELINKHPGILSGDLKNLFNEHRKARDPDVTPAALKKSFSRAIDGLIEKKKARMDGNSVKEGQGTIEGHSMDMSRQVKGTDRDIILKGCPDVPPVSLSGILTLDESDFLEVSP